MNNKTDIEEDIKEINIIITTVRKILQKNVKTIDEEVYTLDGRQYLALENILADRERLEREKYIHIKLEQQYKKEYLDIKNKYDSLVEKVKKKVRYFEENEEFIATGITDINDNYSDGTVIKRFIDTLQKLLDTEKEKA